ncbi:MAG: deoxyribodipyrimidine photo-lyase [Desulfobacterales bacterium]|jgi:deoxyribodipyrimidine photo-lyase
MTVLDTRLTTLNDREVRKGRYVLYWMQQSQRAEYNDALNVAIREANRNELPLLVGFGLTDAYPDANLRHFQFMLEGLQDVEAALRQKGIGMVVRLGSPPDVALTLGHDAALIVCDTGYTRHQKDWRQKVAREADCRVLQVESDAVVPVAVVSDKAEYAARTIRPRINRHLEDYLVLPRAPRLKHRGGDLQVPGLELADAARVLRRLDIDRRVAPVAPFFKGGTKAAKKRLRRFIQHHLARYNDHRNQPQTDDISHMSPYLHFGHISPVYLARRIRDAREGQGIDRAAYLEELIVRRELAINFVHFTPDYDRYASLPPWARKTLAEHAADPRPHCYDREELENAKTHDPYWNAAMQEMRSTGFMHNYMRMYWGKKILEWSATPEEAFVTTLTLNNKYFIDGRDPNSYAGVAWVFGKHDRAWFERSIFGKIRYMAASGLERKCDIRAYVAKVERRIAKADGAH